MNIRNRFVHWGWMAGLLLLLTGCAGTPETPSSRYSIDQDRAPDGAFDVSGLADALPRYEAPRRAGNKSPYTVWGKRYTVRDSNEGYVERGIASWYGEKFHGHKTSNGETFDMYAMSAAHKSLRLPGYARVTNLDNGRTVVVRVNDRGPFHDDRLIDLSYAAAKKLGYHNHGTARVEVAAITVRRDGSMWVAGQRLEQAAPVPAVAAPPRSTDGEALFVQLGSFGNARSAHTLKARAEAALAMPVRLRALTGASGQLHRVQVGPFDTELDARRALDHIESRGFHQPVVLTDTR